MVPFGTNQPDWRARTSGNKQAALLLTTILSFPLLASLETQHICRVQSCFPKLPLHAAMWQYNWAKMLLCASWYAFSTMTTPKRDAFPLSAHAVTVSLLSVKLLIFAECNIHHRAEQCIAFLAARQQDQSTLRFKEYVERGIVETPLQILWLPLFSFEQCAFIISLWGELFINRPPGSLRKSDCMRQQDFGKFIPPCSAGSSGVPSLGEASLFLLEQRFLVQQGATPGMREQRDVLDPFFPSHSTYTNERHCKHGWIEEFSREAWLDKGRRTHENALTEWAKLYKLLIILIDILLYCQWTKSWFFTCNQPKCVKSIKDSFLLKKFTTFLFPTLTSAKSDRIVICAPGPTLSIHIPKPYFWYLLTKISFGIWIFLASYYWFCVLSFVFSPQFFENILKYSVRIFVPMLVQYWLVPVFVQVSCAFKMQNTITPNSAWQQPSWRGGWHFYWAHLSLGTTSSSTISLLPKKLGIKNQETGKKSFKGKISS